MAEERSAIEVRTKSSTQVERITVGVHHVHLIGVGGSAMAALAGMLAERGLRVTGSDNQLYEPASSVLRRLRIEVRSGYSPANLDPPPDLVVVGNVITRSNPEAAALIRTHIPFLSMPEALRQFFLDERRVLMVAGTHGKTTSTAMMARVLEVAGRDPSMMIGGVARDFASNYRCGKGNEFVIEGDEYDTAFFDKGPKFLHYHPTGTIVTAVEFDHADIYRDLDHVKSSFSALSDQLKPEHVLVVSADSPHALEVTARTRARRLTFGLQSGSYRAVGITADADGTAFSIVEGERRLAENIRLSIGGRMNVANALGVWVLLREFGLNERELSAGLSNFSGVSRRQEVIGEAGGIIVVDDFAHHPTAIRATLEAIAERYSGRRILAAFEPRSNTARRSVFQVDFGQAFDRAARVYLAPVYFKENDPIPLAMRLDVAKLAADIIARGPATFAPASVGEIADAILADCRAGDILVCMSNGPFEDLPRRLLKALRADVD
ncbi:MAG TPA: Mur ligase family protein [Candidatus Binataceae bacterium]|nr:Mur ligase family protein [Candidatus Binataceae bacterium]